jgi:hypothetical protein
MREVARTLSDAGISPATMADATAQRHEWLVDVMAAQELEYAEPFDWRALADAIEKGE